MIITSILENDLYKFSMGYYYQVIYPEAIGTFTFKDRNNTKYNKEFVELLRKEFKSLGTLFLQKNEFDWAIRNIPYIPMHYWEWLQSFRFNPNLIQVWLDKKQHLHIEVTDVMYKVTMYEIPILAIVSELNYVYHKQILNEDELWEQSVNNINNKCEIARKNNFLFAEFGMRRRYSRASEDAIMKTLSQNKDVCVGTSTVSFAMKYGMRPIGTMAHELFMATAAHMSPKDANFIVMENWSKVYDGNLGTVLTDTFTVDVFLRSFSMKLAKLYDGVRHDSGDPIEFGNKIIDKYKSYGIDPMSKTIVFSDSLNFKKASEIKEYFKDKIKVTFGIGTNLTNDFIGIKPMNIVMKLKEFQVNLRQPKYGCVKLSDVPSKAIGTVEDITDYKYQLKLYE